MYYVVANLEFCRNQINFLICLLFFKTHCLLQCCLFLYCASMFSTTEMMNFAVRRDGVIVELVDLEAASSQIVASIGLATKPVSEAACRTVVFSACKHCWRLRSIPATGCWMIRLVDKHNPGIHIFAWNLYPLWLLQALVSLKQDRRTITTAPTMTPAIARASAITEPQ